MKPTKTRLVQLQRELLDLRLGREQGIYVSRKAAVQELRRLFTDARVQLEAIPNIAARCVPEADRDRVRDAVQDIIDDKLRTLSGLKDQAQKDLDERGRNVKGSNHE